ncbi:MAG TPA: response regulator transcription factor [Oligoflexia bacterium]|nr:response regulator transcription factor [Oligoflexia bacterium]HMP27286.1 response regulator transcription factor [Oligoflexia bacterium]
MIKQAENRKAKIMVVEDELDILELIIYNLSKEGYTVKGVTNGEEALSALTEFSPDLLILDLMLPGMDGFEVCAEIRRSRLHQQIPIFMLTAKGEEADVVSGLEVGADDYLSKPFSPKILLARVRSLLRRQNRRTKNHDQVLKSGELTIDTNAHQVLIKNRKLNLTGTEFKLLHHLVVNAGTVFQRNDIIKNIHGADYPATARSIDVQILNLRKKLGRHGKHIQSVRGIGYRYQDN